MVYSNSILLVNSVFVTESRNAFKMYNVAGNLILEFCCLLM